MSTFHNSDYDYILHTISFTKYMILLVVVVFFVMVAGQEGVAFSSVFSMETFPARNSIFNVQYSTELLGPNDVKQTAPLHCLAFKIDKSPLFSWNSFQL